jgi:hypothetical protein
MVERLLAHRIEVVHLCLLSGKPAIGFIDIDLTARELFEHLQPRIGCGLLTQAKLVKQRVEARAGRRIADPKVSLEILHVSARRKEDAQHLAVLSAE